MRMLDGYAGTDHTMRRTLVENLRRPGATPRPTDPEERERALRIVI
jgi:hypothetical protein